MFTRKIVLLLALMRIWNASLVHSFLEEGLLAKSIGPWVTYSNLRTVQLLNQLCNDSQDESSVERDACYGCFFRASNQASGYPMLLAMSNCADIYLNNTDYGHCQRYIRNATNSASSRTSPNTIYCTFLECVRQVNKDMLIRECIGEAMEILPTVFNGTEQQLAQVFVNTTACILARARCTVFQDMEATSRTILPTVNAVLVNSDYDISVVKFPYILGKGEGCTRYRNMEQATWPGVDC
ncbi:uncharacterized protein LOC107264933 isoform X1 [Cephus cinctus]|uniref:Uncharacterized protein LOC107264933 isoform X1 n=1 Tax=Cephus cinctus TaxID=211228 RepID=A0AAJ7FFH3_CEPCN|nr:uncharacterized protein LOC107264933 isoform X1 [Cephus cinctus]